MEMEWNVRFTSHYNNDIGTIFSNQSTNASKVKEIINFGFILTAKIITLLNTVASYSNYVLSCLIS